MDDDDDDDDDNSDDQNVDDDNVGYWLFWWCWWCLHIYHIIDNNYSRWGARPANNKKDISAAELNSDDMHSTIDARLVAIRKVKKLNMNFNMMRHWVESTDELCQSFCL